MLWAALSTTGLRVQCRPRRACCSCQCTPRAVNLQQDGCKPWPGIHAAGRRVHPPGHLTADEEGPRDHYWGESEAIRPRGSDLILDAARFWGLCRIGPPESNRFPSGCIALNPPWPLTLPAWILQRPQKPLASLELPTNTCKQPLGTRRGPGHTSLPEPGSGLLVKGLFSDVQIFLKRHFLPSNELSPHGGESGLARAAGALFWREKE